MIDGTGGKKWKEAEHGMEIEDKDGMEVNKEEERVVKEARLREGKPRKIEKRKENECSMPIVIPDRLDIDKACSIGARKRRKIRNCGEREVAGVPIISKKQTDIRTHLQTLELMNQTRPSGGKPDMTKDCRD